MIRVKDWIFFTLAPILLYALLVYLRLEWNPFGCQSEAEACLGFRVLWIDHWALNPSCRGSYSGDDSFDSLSTNLQNLSGLIAWIIPCFYFFWNYFKKHEKSLWLKTSKHSMLFIQVAFWNGVGVEASHLFFPRMRPYGYLDLPMYIKGLPNFTSFYSGHTSFTAAASTFLVLTLIQHKAPRYLIILFILLGEGLLITTGYCRIIAGRHFFSDVLTAALAGTLIAYLICLPKNPVKITNITLKRKKKRRSIS